MLKKFLTMLVLGGSLGSAYATTDCQTFFRMYSGPAAYYMTVKMSWLANWNEPFSYLYTTSFKDGYAQLDQSPLEPNPIPQEFRHLAGVCSNSQLALNFVDQYGNANNQWPIFRADISQTTPSDGYKVILTGIAKVGMHKVTYQLQLQKTF